MTHSLTIPFRFARRQLRQQRNRASRPMIAMVHRANLQVILSHAEENDPLPDMREWPCPADPDCPGEMKYAGMPSLGSQRFKCNECGHSETYP